MNRALSDLQATHEETDQLRYHILDGSGRDESPKSDPRRMVKSTLLGQHSHSTSNGISVHIYEREKTLIARGRYQGRAFGVTLGQSPAEAQPRLFQLMAELDNGSFVPPHDRRHRRLRKPTRSKLTARELFDDFLDDRRKHRGRKTADTYLTRLMPILDFLDQPRNRKRWPRAEDIDRTCLLELRAYLITRQVTRNGRAGAAPKPMSPRQIQNCLETLRTAINWALRADVRKLPVDLRNPVSQDLIGQPAQKDPLRKAAVPLEVRIRIAQQMDLWELTHLSALLILPLRHDDHSGVLVSDVNWTSKTLSIGTRFGGSDFTKAHVSYSIPLHPLLLQLWSICADQRPDGILFRTPKSCRKPTAKDRTKFSSRREVEECVATALQSCNADDVQTEYDRKRVIRKYFTTIGGMSPSDVGRALTRLFNRAGLPDGNYPYQLKGSTSQSMRESGMPHFELRYFTGHTTADIMNEYVGLEHEKHMAVYYESITALLDVIRDRAKWLGLSLDDHDHNDTDVSAPNSVRQTAG